ncbi:hypothetical protein PEC18_35360 [Paucibacter sp. O1-1]|nr:hypothetical protein [Paucibacter sp. O1-1]MDA3830947.1 hypothetical protein [Paucibacter sp. O1-1]
MRCFGEVKRGSFGYEMFHPEYSLADEFTTTTESAQLTPTYPLTEGLTQIKMRSFCRQALENESRHTM